MLLLWCEPIGMEAVKQSTCEPGAARGRRLLLVLLAAVALAGGYRAAQLAMADAELTRQAGDRAERATIQQELPTPSSQPPTAKHQQLSARDMALLAMACPQSLDSMPPELRAALQGSTSSQPTRLPPPYRQTVQRGGSGPNAIASQPRARITGVRVAERQRVNGQPLRQQPTDRQPAMRVALQTGQPNEKTNEKDWLVSPDEWFVPEDRAVAAPAESRAPAEVAEPPLPQMPSPPAAPPTPPDSSPDSSPAGPTTESTERTYADELPELESPAVPPVSEAAEGQQPKFEQPKFEQPTIEHPTFEPPATESSVEGPSVEGLPVEGLPVEESPAVEMPLVEPPVQPLTKSPVATPSVESAIAEPAGPEQSQVPAEPDTAEIPESPAEELPGVVENPYATGDGAAFSFERKQSEQLPRPENRQPTAPQPITPRKVPPLFDGPGGEPIEERDAKAERDTEEVPAGVKESQDAADEIPLDLPLPRSPVPTMPTVPRSEQHFSPPAAQGATDITPIETGEKSEPSTSIFAPPSAAPARTPAKPPAAVVPHSPHGKPAKKLTKAEQAEADKSHRELFQENCYPSARDCAKCHKQQYEEWSISSHAYAFVSPMFHKFEQKITDLSQGTVGYFCMRCHSPVSVAMCESRNTPIWDMAEVAREGVTCIACHRVNEAYAKTNGERRVVPGSIYDPVYGGIGGKGIAEAIADKAKYKVKTSPDEKGAGQPIHREGRFFEHLSQAEFCTSCHQVAVHPGIKLEVVWEQYRASPACKKGVTCQECHMGTVPGVPSPYEIGSIAEVGGKSVCESREHANHTFYGPGYSIAHPGIFPFHKDGNRWTMPEWLAFDWRAGWGTDDFEDAVDDGKIKVAFPKVWQEADDRYDAREIIEDNIARLGKKRELRRQVMEHGSKVTGPHFKHPPRCGTDLKFDYIVTNLNEGHNLPTASLGAQPQLWANVVLINPLGQRVWETGYTDAYGDLADIHSEEVRHGRVPFDSQLFNLQTMFLITGATGTDREFTLPVNVSFDQVPLLRPGALPISVLNHPPFIRMESRSLPPLGSKRVKYRVPADRLRMPGRYRLSFRMRSRTEPIYFMRFCESTDEMQRSMNEGILDIHPYSVEFEVR